MPTPALAASVLDREFLGIRSRLIDLAATLDRIERSEAAPGDDSRLLHIRRALEILLGPGASRTERIQTEFSLPYEENWRES